MANGYRHEGVPVGYHDESPCFDYRKKIFDEAYAYILNARYSISQFLLAPSVNVLSKVRYEKHLQNCFVRLGVKVPGL
jgi:hypothetical protein